jgi:hypothetical protein
MIIIETEDFKKDLKNLPSEIKRLYQRQKLFLKKIGLIQDCIRKELKNFLEFILSGLPAVIEFFFILGMGKLYFLRLATEKKFTGKFKQINHL